MRSKSFRDLLVMPSTNEAPQERIDSGVPLLGTPGEAYVERRGIPVAVAHAAGIRFDPDWHGRPAVICPMFDHQHTLCSVHGRYLEQAGRENKMLTIGAGGGVFWGVNNEEDTPVILVEGVFDALSLAVCGCGAIATVGREASWLPEYCVGRRVILAFDGNRPGEAEAGRYAQWLVGARVSRLTPPGKAKDWNTALVKQGKGMVVRWLSASIKHQ
jgi:Toprim-like